MIEEEAVVVRVESGRVWVEKQRQSACGSCSKSCDAAAVGDAMAAKPVVLSMLSDMEVYPGDRVLVGIREDALVAGSIGMYLLPLIGLFLGAVLGKAVGLAIEPGLGDLGAIGGGLFGLTGSFILLKHTPILWRNKFDPVVLRKLG